MRAINTSSWNHFPPSSNLKSVNPDMLIMIIFVTWVWKMLICIKKIKKIKLFGKQWINLFLKNRNLKVRNFHFLRTRPFQPGNVPLGQRDKTKLYRQRGLETDEKMTETFNPCPQKRIHLLSSFHTLIFFCGRKVNWSLLQAFYGLEEYAFSLPLYPPALHPQINLFIKNPTSL